MPPPGTTVLRRQLGAELRKLRGKISREQVAAVLDCALSRVGHIETGRNVPSKLEFDALMVLFDASPEQHERLEELRKKARQKPGWSSTSGLPSWLKLYVDMELDAEKMSAFNGEVVNGLLQTEEYARQVHAVAAPLFSASEIELFIAARKLRQQRLVDGNDPLVLSEIVSEAAFRRMLGDPEVGPAQLAHVIEMAQRPNITLHVLPFADPREHKGSGQRRGGLHASMSGSFSVISFAGDIVAPVGYEEHAIGGHVTDARAEVKRLMELWEVLRTQALSPDESLTWLSELLPPARE